MGVIRANVGRMAAASVMGGCPECGGCDGNVNLRKLNVGVCHLHRYMWAWGEGLVSTPDRITWDDLERSFEKQLGEYTWVDFAEEGVQLGKAPAALAGV